MTGLAKIGFSRSTGFGAARSYRLVVDGKTYDSKAIVGAAHGFLPGQEALTAHDFSGGAVFDLDSQESLGNHGQHLDASEPTGHDA